MRIAIMQPYFCPYLGYFQLIGAVDTFVIYDDVNYIRQGWINRNHIISKGARQRITLNVFGGSQNALINDVRVGDNRGSILRSIQQCYSKAPFFESVFPFLVDVISASHNGLSEYLTYSIENFCGFLEIKTPLVISSALGKDNRLRGESKILAICSELGGTHYINAEGGQGLYSSQRFAENGIGLSFLHHLPPQYRQYGDAFLPNLSIVDVLMFNHRSSFRHLLGSFRLSETILCNNSNDEKLDD